MSEERKIAPKRFAVRPERFEKLWRRFLDDIRARKMYADWPFCSGKRRAES